MIPVLAKTIAARLPHSWQQRLKRLHFAHQIRAGRFRTPEPEFDLLATIIRPATIAIDVGANVGHYSVEMARLVGPDGALIAFEPIAETYNLLIHNLQAAKVNQYARIQAYRAAASDHAGRARMEHPKFNTGLDNNYEAHIGADDGDGELVRTATIDSIPFGPGRVSCIKIDVEGHELAVLRGAQSTINQHRPVLIVEDNDPLVWPWLRARGYVADRLYKDGVPSPNVVWYSLSNPIDR